MNELNIQRGNPLNATIRVTDTSVTPAVAYNLTGLTVFFTLKHMSDVLEDDSAALIKKTITVHTTPADGYTLLVLTAVDTAIAEGRYKCDLRIYSLAGVQLNTSKFFANVVDIVTKRIT